MCGELASQFTAGLQSYASEKPATDEAEPFDSKLEAEHGPRNR
jgi:hypothetical protein